MTTNLIVLIILLILSAFFSATEVAFVSLSDSKVSAMVKKRRKRANLIKKLTSNRRRLLITILIGNNIVNIAAASLATIVTSEFFSSAVLGITTGIMTLLILIFGEIIPKSYAANSAEKFAAFSAPLLRLLSLVGLPFIIIFEGLTILFTGKQIENQVSEEELKAMALTGARQGTIETQEKHLIERLFSLNDITAEDVMTPRVNIIYLNHDMSVEEAAEIIAENPHTRFPVAEDTPDKIIGFIHSRDILIAFKKGNEKNLINKIIHPIIAVPQQMLIDNLLREFQKKNTHIAIVLDEFGGTEGIVTLEDVLEELVGEITDEHDITKDMIHRVDKNTIIVAGDTELRDINDFLNCNIQGEPFDTIAETILDTLKKLPRKDKQIEFENVTCTILEIKNRSISKVKIQKKHAK